MSWAHLKHTPKLFAFNEYGGIHSIQNVKSVYLHVKHGVIHWIHLFVDVNFNAILHDVQLVEEPEHVKHYDTHG